MIFIKDNFLKSPYDLKNYARLKERKWIEDSHMRWPGKRCYEVPELIKKLILNEAVSATNNTNLKIREFDIFFHKINSKDTQSGWTHWDEGYKHAAILYLSETNENDVGTEIYDYYWNTDYPIEVEKFRQVRQKYLQEKNKNFLNRFLFKLVCNKFNKKFDKNSIRINYKFNRFISYESTRLHRPQNLFSSTKEDRLNVIVFFT